MEINKTMCLTTTNTFDAKNLQSCTTHLASKNEIGIIIENINK
jgi:hypothetical protein